MGLFKQMKDLKNVVAEAPAMVAQAQQLAAQAQQLQATQAAQVSGAGANAGLTSAGLANAGLGGTVTPAELEPIAGISLERYAQLAKSVGERQLQGVTLESFLASHGHTQSDWQQSYDGWNARMKANMALSTQFAALFQQAASL